MKKPAAAKRKAAPKKKSRSGKSNWAAWTKKKDKKKGEAREIGVQTDEAGVREIGVQTNEAGDHQARDAVQATARSAPPRDPAPMTPLHRIPAVQQPTLSASFASTKTYTAADRPALVPVPLSSSDVFLGHMQAIMHSCMYRTVTAVCQQNALHGKQKPVRV